MAETATTETEEVEIEAPVVEGTAENTEAVQPKDESVWQFSKIYQKLKYGLKYGKELEVAVKEVEQSLLGLPDVRLCTIFQSVDNGKEILAAVKGGDPDDDSIEIRAPFSITSLTGYVALSQRTLVIKNVKNSEELADIHPHLQFASSFSDAKGWKVKSRIALPDKDDVLSGVMQLLNFQGDRDFIKEDLKHAMVVS